jgi:hypothetical protein
MLAFTVLIFGTIALIFILNVVGYCLIAPFLPQPRF